MIIFREKQYSKVYMKDGSHELDDLSDKLLENITKYKGPSKWWKSHVTYPGIAAGGAAGMIVSKAANKNIAAGGLIGAGIIGAGHLAAHLHHKNNAEKAKKILEKRKKDK